MRRYAVLIEKTSNGWGAYVPDLPGCVAAGATYEETEQLIREAIPFHIEGMHAHGERVPEPLTHIEYVEVDTAA